MCPVRTLVRDIRSSVRRDATGRAVIGRSSSQTAGRVRQFRVLRAVGSSGRQHVDDGADDHHGRRAQAGGRRRTGQVGQRARAPRAAPAASRGARQPPAYPDRRPCRISSAAIEVEAVHRHEQHQRAAGRGQPGPVDAVDRGPPGSRWPDTTVKSAATPRWVSGIPAIGRRRERRTDPGNDRHRHSGGNAGEPLLAAAAEHERVAALQAHHPLAGQRPLDDDRVDLVLASGCADAPTCRSRSPRRPRAGRRAARAARAGRRRRRRPPPPVAAPGR